MGEAGLDKLAAAPMELQVAVFKEAGGIVGKVSVCH